MSSPNSTPPVSDLPDQGATAVVDGLEDPPIEEEFWKKYNAHLEFPIGSALSVLAHVAIVGLLVAVLFGYLGGVRDKKPVSVISLGDDDSGAGMLNGGGEEQQQLGGATPPEQSEQTPDLKDVREDLAEKIRIEDPTANIEIPDVMVEAYRQLDKDLRDKLLGAKQKGSGSGTAGGTEGTGSDSTRARGLRWIMRFSTRSGQDYLNQLKALKAVVMIPVPPRNEKMIYLRDLGNPQINQYASDADIAEQAGKIQFQDVRPASTAAIQEALRLPFQPNTFIAFFPRELEEEMSRKETGFQNKKSQDIKETVFQVLISGGQARLQVVSQKLK